MKTHRLTPLAALLALSFLAAPAMAADATSNPAYWIDSAGQVVHNASGECWRSGAWSPALSTAPCDPALHRTAAVPAPVVVAQAAPAPVAAPAPAAVPLVVVPPPLKVSFSGDALFAFDRSVLRPQSLVLLDDLVGQLVGTNFESIAVTGHTDRLGSAAYNQKLSERRAMAVKDYLVSKNVQATRIDATGLGETQPQTASADCKGSKARAALIACLQPDRRVDIEMRGTRSSQTVR